MPQKRNLKEPILKLRTEGKSYREIQKILNCAKYSVQYHCTNHELTDIGLKRHPITEQKKHEIADYCKSHKPEEAVAYFGISLSSAKRYAKYGLEV